MSIEQVLKDYVKSERIESRVAAMRAEFADPESIVSIHDSDETLADCFAKAPDRNVVAFLCAYPSLPDDLPLDALSAFLSPRLVVLLVVQAMLHEGLRRYAPTMLTNAAGKGCEVRHYVRMLPDETAEESIEECRAAVKGLNVDTVAKIAAAFLSYGPTAVGDAKVRAAAPVGMVSTVLGDLCIGELVRRNTESANPVPSAG